MEAFSREYLELLDARSDLSSAKKKLHYGYVPLDVNEVYLNFSATLPEVLDGKVDHMGSVFVLGGALMGAPPHHHGPAVNLLAHGRKLWLLDPPGRELVVHEPIYDYLLRTDGARSSSKCIQQPGDLLYVPRGWSHGTLCLGDCVGVSLEPLGSSSKGRRLVAEVQPPDVRSQRLDAKSAEKNACGAALLSSAELCLALLEANLTYDPDPANVFMLHGIAQEELHFLACQQS